MRSALPLLIFLLVAGACMDPIGTGPAASLPPMPPPRRAPGVIDEIDSARRAAEAEQMMIDDPRAQQQVEDSISSAANDTMILRMLRARRQPLPDTTGP